MTTLPLPAKIRPQGRVRSLRPPTRVLLLLPALMFLVVMTQAPFLLTLWYSFHNWILTSPDLGHAWVGIDNFRYEITQDPIFRTAVVNSLVMTTSIVGVSLVFGLGSVIAVADSDDLGEGQLPGITALPGFLLAPGSAVSIRIVPVLELPPNVQRLDTRFHRLVMSGDVPSLSH